MENLLDEKAAQRKWDDRDWIGLSSYLILLRTIGYLIIT